VLPTCAAAARLSLPAPAVSALLARFWRSCVGGGAARSGGAAQARRPARTMAGGTGSRSRYAHTIGEVDALRHGALGLTALAALMFLLAVVVRAQGEARLQDVRSLAGLGTMLLVTSLVVAAQTAAPNTQRDDNLPEKTWRDYANRVGFRKNFRFAAADIPRLVKALGFDADEAAGRCYESGYKFSADTAISVLLYSMATGATLHQINEHFGIKRSKASAVLRWSLSTAYERWHRPLFCTDFRRWAPQFPAWAAAVYARQGREEGYPGIVAFLDGTFFSTCRPKSALQRFYFSGHKWDHGVHFEGVQSPIGLLIDFCGPFEGRHTDKWMLKVSKLVDRFEACMEWAAEQPFGGPRWAAQLYYLFGDAGYNKRPWLMVQFSGNNLTPNQTACNYSLSRTRIANEWIYGRMENLWKILSREGELKIGRGNVGEIVTVAALLTNALTCCDGGNQTSEYFGLTHLVPTLEQYFEGAPAADACPRPWYENWDEFPQL